MISTNTKNKITSHLWYNSEAEGAAKFYVSLFQDSSIGRITRYSKAGFEIHGQPAGKVMTIEFELEGQKFVGLNGGPFLKFNPSISFILNFDPSKDISARENLDRLWQELSIGGTILMPLQEYPFSSCYGWMQDKFGLSWQIILSNSEGEVRPFIIPSMMFVGATYGKAKEAVDFYLSVFKNSRRGIFNNYTEGIEPDKEGTIMFCDFMIENQWFAAMDSAYQYEFSFNEAISFIINCKNQDEIDYYWDKLSAIPEAEQCGWLKDKFGISWQVVPTILSEMLLDDDKARVENVTNAFLKMKKFNIAELEKAYTGK